MAKKRKDGRPLDFLNKLYIHGEFSPDDKYKLLKMQKKNLTKMYPSPDGTKGKLIFSVEFFDNTNANLDLSPYSAITGTRLCFTYTNPTFRFTYYVDENGDLMAREYFDRGDIKQSDITKLFTGIESKLRSGPKSNDEFKLDVYQRAEELRQELRPESESEKITIGIGLRQYALEKNLMDGTNQAEEDKVAEKIKKSVCPRPRTFSE